MRRAGGWILDSSWLVVYVCTVDAMVAVVEYINNSLAVFFPRDIIRGFHPQRPKKCGDFHAFCVELASSKSAPRVEIGDDGC